MTAKDPAFLQTAATIGRRLCRDAIWSDGECNWLGWSMSPIGHQWTLAYRAQEGGVYDGTAGIALFLSRLHQFTGEKIFAETARGALRQSLAASAAMDDRTKPGFYNGLVGVGYVCLEAGQQLGDDFLVERGFASLDAACAVAPDPQLIDILAGSAGAIPALLDLAERYDRPALSACAEAHARHLLASATKSDEGLSWDTMQGNSDKHLLGYAHGAGGIACALLEMWAATGDQSYRDAADEAFRYERAHFDAAQRNWPDFRKMDMGMGIGIPIPQPAGPNFMVAWCHGASGVGFSRLRAYQLHGADEPLAAEIQTALQTTADSLAASAPLGYGNFSLCHGTGGNAELFLVAAEVLDKPEYREFAESIGQGGVALYHATDSPWPCGVQMAGETPNLMLGLSGIGHFYLRLYDPEAVPSVLLVTPPRARATETADAQAETTGAQTETGQQAYAYAE